MANYYGVNELVPTPMYPGFLRGYRAFSLCTRHDIPEKYECREHFDQVLHSVFMSGAHTPGVNVAHCGKNGGGHLAPAPHGPCRCGFYAAHRGFPLEYLDRPVFAVIKATGRILLSDIGFRAERTEIEALSIGDRKHWNPGVFNRLHGIGRHFNVPTFEDPVEMLAAYPPQDLTGLIQVPEVDYRTWWPCQTLYSERGPYHLLQEPGTGQSFVLTGPDGEVIDIPRFHRRLTVFDGKSMFTIERSGHFLLGIVEHHTGGGPLLDRPIIEAE